MTTLYLDFKNGVDTNDGSSGAPLKTLAHAVASHLANGDTLKIRGSSAADEIHYMSYVSHVENNADDGGGYRAHADLPPHRHYTAPGR